MPMFPMFLLLQVRTLGNPHHILEDLVGWLVGQNVEALLCLLGRDICCVAPGFVLFVLQCVGVPDFVPYVLCRLGDGGHILGAHKVNWACHPVFLE